MLLDSMATTHCNYFAEYGMDLFDLQTGIGSISNLMQELGARSSVLLERSLAWLTLTGILAWNL